MKHIILSAFLFVIITTSIQAQNIIVVGANPAWEGSQVTYKLRKSDYLELPPGISNISFTVSGGTKISEQTTPYILDQPVSVTVQWDCLATSGEILVNASIAQPGGGTQNFSYTYPVSIISYTNYPEMCRSISPQDQSVLYNQLPQILSITNCSPFCEGTYNFTYQWQQANVGEEGVTPIPESYWTNLTTAGATNSTYQPLPMLSYDVKAYRRVTKYHDLNSQTDPQPIITKYSDPAFVRFTTRLDPGEISTTTSEINAFHIVPVIASTPAYGGLCEAVNYTYQWQMSSAATNFIWVSIGNSEQFPSDAASILSTTRYRRRVICGTETKYTNELVITFKYISPYSENLNYVRELLVHKRGIKTWEMADGWLDFNQKEQSTTYIDGVGREVQAVKREAATPASGSNDWTDIVSFKLYNNEGLPTKEYLPYTTSSQIGYFKTDVLTNQLDYYLQNYNEGEYTFSSITYKQDPLNRISNVKLPGSSWSQGLGNSVEWDDVYNVLDEKVPHLKIGSSVSENPQFQGYYGKYELYKKVVKDENNSKSIEYSDKSGKLIMKKTQLSDDPAVNAEGWLCTVYVYDGFGRLRYSIEPEAVRVFTENEWQIETPDGIAALDKLCYKYVYDKRGRVIVKKNPDAEEIHMVYDIKNRPVLVQNGNQRSNSTPKWTVTVYDMLDGLDRPFITAEIEDNKTRENFQIDADSYDAEGMAEFLLNNIVNGANATVLKQFYYDHYTFSNAQQFDNTFQNSNAYATGGEVMPIKESKRTLGNLTGTKVLILGTSDYLNTTIYYDEEGRQQQTISDNILRTQDISTMQYHWDGRVLSQEKIHDVAGTTQFRILTKNTYDKIGRVTQVSKKIYNEPFKAIVNYDYDDFGRVKTKHIDPDYTGTDGMPDIETQNFSYNIQGWLRGINKDYALKTPGLYNKWGNENGKFFGMCLGYDYNEEGMDLNNPLLTGQIAANVWNTMGDDVQRKYQYSYDRAGRLAKADFSQKKNIYDGFNTTELDYSISGNGNDGKIVYDLNGNITSLIRKGVAFGETAPKDIDLLEYTYQPLTSGSAYYSNRLTKVTDNGQMGNNNGSLGDFTDGTFGLSGNDDYDYDANGNIIMDLNKEIKDITGSGMQAGIKYNYLNKPEEIVFEATSDKPRRKITIVYDADGRKLKSHYQENPAVSGDIKTTIYIDEFIYSEVTSTSHPVPLELTQVNFGEGRIRIMENSTASNAENYVVLTGSMAMPNNKNGVYDFFIQDNLQNIRMIVTEEVHEGSNICKVEPGPNAGDENQIFWQSNGGAPPTNAIVFKSSVPNWNDNLTGTRVVKLSKNGTKIGPNVLLKVMAGDEVSANSIYFYENYQSEPPFNTTLLDPIANAFTQSILGSPTVPTPAKDPVVIQNIEGWYNNPGNTIFSNEVAPNQGVEDNKPKAYLTVLFFDERFNFLPDESISQRVGGPGNNPDPYPLAITNVKAPRNGYVYVYVSNESNTPVYFDNMQVVFKRGRIVEENHYYPFGLKIATISSGKVGHIKEGVLKNNYLYQGAYSEFDSHTGWNDFALRNYDPQIGRWVQQDPYDEFSSPYVGMGNDPVGLIDPMGGDTWLGDMLIGAGIGAAVGGIYAAIKKQDVFKGAALGSVLGAGVGSLYAIANNATGVFVDATGTDFTKPFSYVFNGLLAANSVMINEIIFHNTNIDDLFNSTFLALGTGALDGYIKQNWNLKVSFNPILGGNNTTDKTVFDFGFLIAPAIYGFLDRLVYANRHKDELSLNSSNKILGYAFLGMLDGIGSGVASNLPGVKDNFSQISLFGSTITGYSLLPHRKLGMISGLSYGLFSWTGPNLFYSLGNISDKNGGWRFGLAATGNYLYYRVFKSLESINQLGGSVRYTRR